MSDVKILVSGTGAAGVACINTLLEAGARQILCCDRLGALYPGRVEGMNPIKEEIAQLTNSEGIQSSLKEALVGVDVFIGLSAGNLLEPKDLEVMAPKSIVFALANPIPEVNPWEALDYAQIVATGRSDFPNQINNAVRLSWNFQGSSKCTGKEDHTGDETGSLRRNRWLNP